ncbi:MAG: type III restriction endonuclease subunit R [Candidatus Accumulibacter sp.]|jgi:superfamily II DNA or RNA helicase|nr:type III restriction endonuclease subunit R [Accumulibacter sp.]
MKRKFEGWEKVASNLLELAREKTIELNKGQQASIEAIAVGLPNNGVIIADEVGMGKTRIAATTAKAVLNAGGRVAILVPPGLGYQWGDELRQIGVDAPPILRSLWQYFSAWESDDKSQQCPWFNESIILISHAFTNWRLGEKSTPWRWTLLPELYARLRKELSGRHLPRGYHDNEKLGDEWVKNTAISITEFVEALPKRHPARKLAEELTKKELWPWALKADEYERNAELRSWLEQAVGFGLGVFDLVIIDEAHKSRGQDSGLYRLVEQVVLQVDTTRRMAVTATPIELGEKQWKQILQRIKVNEDSLSGKIKAYADAVRKVRQNPSNKEYLEYFKITSKQFEEALSPYLLRRDKREDDAIKKFCKYTREPYHAYRHEEEISIEAKSLPPKWKQAMCAAEVLSFVTRKIDASVLKRLRLTLGNGHGLAALIDQTQRGDEDKKQDEYDEKQKEENDKQSEKQKNTDDTLSEVGKEKRTQRAQWWTEVMTQPFPTEQGDAALYDHPAILAAVEKIEKICRKEKVLVFGRFIRPLRALVDLLNAREMLLCLKSGRPWPQSKVHDKSEQSAIKAAHHQLWSKVATVDLDNLDELLDKQYKKLERKRRKFREKLLLNIDKGFQYLGSQCAKGLFDAFKREVEEGEDKSLVWVDRAMWELIDPEKAKPEDFARAFIDLIKAASDRPDDIDADDDTPMENFDADARWNDLAEIFEREYGSSREGGFARLMNGDTKHNTRRFLQLAFNRRHGYPKVLVAQSLVGREGLNLHKACRTIILLHPEWNPGVVEQQIGRVDRLGSFWEDMLDKAIEQKLDVPKINIHPIVFKGTYDEENWRVLRERWDDLRAQLHGLVMSPRTAENWPKDLIEEINSSAPNFSSDTSARTRHILTQSSAILRPIEAHRREKSSSIQA